jgi:two-component system cell cycle sensor histidine kinase/response regulator CckA
MTIGALAIGIGGTRRIASPANGQRAVHRHSSWLHRFASTWLVFAVIAGVAGAAAIALTVAGAAGPVPSSALAGLALAAAAVGSAGWAGAIIGRWLAVLGQAFEAASEAQLVAGPDGRAVQANFAFERLFPRTAEAALEVVERAGADRGAAAAFRSLREQAAAGADATATISLRPADGGAPRHFEISVEPGAGRSPYRLWTFRDSREAPGVGARGPQPPTVSRPCAAPADLLDQAPSGFYSLDSAGRVAGVNCTVADGLGVTPAKLIEGDVRLREILAEPTPPPQASAPEVGGLPDEPSTITLSSHRGAAFDVQIGAHPAATGGGFREYVVRRLSPLQCAPDRAVGQSRETLRRFFVGAPVGIAVVDRAGRFIKANRALGELFEASPETLVGRGLIDCLNPDDRQAIAAKLADAADGRENRTPVEIRLTPPGERTMVMLLSRFDQSADTMASVAGRSMSVVPAPAIIPPPDFEGDPIEGLTLYFIDVTERKQLEAQFVQSQKMLAVGQLAGGVAHDFNNLLTAIIGFCDLLLLRSRPGDPAFADIMQIKQNANRAANLVRQLLAFSRQQSLQPRVLDVTDVLVELSHLLRRLIGENIDLEFAHGRDLGLVKVDQGQLEQVVINLAVNARDAMPEGGRLTIRTENSSHSRAVRRGHEIMPAGDYLLIEVVDTGVGIAPDHLARIFEPFFSTKAVGAGTGLGLSTVYGIVRQTGGFVFVESKPGAGTTFSIYLPRHQAAAAVDAASAEVAEPGVPRDLTGTGTIMLVEDDDAVRMFGARALRNKGYQVIEARSGEAALDLINNTNHPIDLLISDVVMPQMDGPALVREVREDDPGIKVIFISGYAEDAFRQRLDSDRDIHFLAKPFSLKQLAVKVKDVIGSDLAGSQFPDCVHEQIRYTLGSAARCSTPAAVK